VEPVSPYDLALCPTEFCRDAAMNKITVVTDSFSVVALGDHRISPCYLRSR
jgi:hypothetical protein